jgi:anaerobic ribonucleoside-triphosphate reductase
MKDVNKYLEFLIEFAERKLNTHFKIDKLAFDNFEIVNSYLIYQTIKDNKKKINTLIYIPDKETKSQFYR